MKWPFFSSTNTSGKYYFGLFLKESKGIGYILHEKNSRILIEAKLDFVYSDGWEHLTEDVDDVLFKLEQEAHCHVDRVIFFLFSHLIDETTKEIKQPFLHKIKDMSKNLELKPVGYIECHEAVASFLHDKDAISITSMLIEMDDTNIDVFVYKGGHKVRSVTVARTDNIIDDLTSAFMTVSSSTLLPNRIILYNSTELLDESTKIISHKWSSDLFVQLPRVEIMQEKDITRGLIAVFERQIQAGEGVDAEKEETKSVLGFVIGEDVVQFQEQSEPVAERKGEVPQDSFFNKGTSFFQKIKDKVQSVSGARKKALFIPILVLLCFFGIATATLFFTHKATVTLVLPNKILETSFTEDFDLEAYSSSTLLIASSSFQLNESKATTGKKDIGEYATGEVTLYSFDDKEKEFPKGTTIQVDSIKFTTDDDVAVPASTLATDGSAKLPGKEKVKVTAAEIGTEANIDKGKRFRIDDLSSSEYFAMNDSAFTGGTKKTLHTVSDKDLEDLKTSLLEKAKENQKVKSFGTKDANITYIDKLIDFQLDKAQYSKEVGEEGDSVSLQAKVTVKFYYIENNRTVLLLAKKFASDIPDGYSLDLKNISFTIGNVKKDADSIRIEFNAKAITEKKVNMTEIAAYIKGKQIDAAKAYLKQEIGVKDVSFDIVPVIGFLRMRLPLFNRNIDLRVGSD